MLEVALSTAACAVCVTRGWGIVDCAEVVGQSDLHNSGGKETTRMRRVKRSSDNIELQEGWQPVAERVDTGDLLQLLFAAKCGKLCGKAGNSTTAASLGHITDTNTNTNTNTNAFIHFVEFAALCRPSHEPFRQHYRPTVSLVAVVPALLRSQT